MRKSLTAVVFYLFIAAVVGKELTRSKRQMNVYYMCGNYPNSYVSQYPCSGSGNGCGYNNCNGISTVGILPTSFYTPYSNCNNGCSNLNCNQYNGMWVNGQYVAYAYGSNQYNPCASSCCQGYNYNNAWNNGFNNGYIPNLNGFNNGYNPYNNNIGNGVVPGVPIGSGAVPTGVGNGATLVGVGPCGGVEQSTGYCARGYCSDGSVCTQGNICCRCSVGASNGQCANGVGCSAGFSCMPNGYCCATTPWQSGVPLQVCMNNSCREGYRCGEGNLCYPAGSTVPGQDCIYGRCPVGYSCGSDNKCYSNAGK